VIRLSLLQFRVQALTAAATLAVFAVLLGVTGPHLASMYAASGLGSCRGSSCQNLALYFSFQFDRSPYAVLYKIGIGVILLAPAVTGLFWGAPLIARELETGTSALAWNQSVTRTRWLAVKLTVGGLTAVVVTEGLCLLQSWWAAPLSRTVGDGLDLAGNQFSPLVFATHGITPVGYAAFAFALGVLTGALIRRTIPAMAVTLAIFAAVQVAMPLWIRPNFIPRDHALVPFAAVPQGDGGAYSPDGYMFTFTVSDVPGQLGSWVLSSGPVDAAGRPDHIVPSACTRALDSLSPISVFASCLDGHGLREAVTYQPASRYWPFQGIETGIYLTLALALTGFCFRRVHREPS
jgi:hypothetical protein